MAKERYFICPHCGNRSMGADRNAGFRREARGCDKCGFAYLFELLDDYYPAPGAAFFACDRDGRIVDCGRGSFELTGLKTEQVMGRPARDVLGLQFEDGGADIGTPVLVSGGVASSSTTLSPAIHALSAVFTSIDPAFNGSTSPTVRYVVAAPTG